MKKWLQEQKGCWNLFWWIFLVVVVADAKLGEPGLFGSDWDDWAPVVIVLAVMLAAVEIIRAINRLRLSIEAQPATTKDAPP